MAKGQNKAVATPAPAKTAAPAAPKAATPAASNHETDPGNLLVLDKLATEGARTHPFAHPDNGRPFNVTFADAQTQVPLDRRVAIKLVGNDGFEVRTLDGKLLQKRKVAEIDGVTVAADQCIANYDELTTVALWSRLVHVPGHGLHKDSSKEAMVSAMINFNDPDQSLEPPADDMSGIEFVDGDGLRADEDPFPEDPEPEPTPADPDGPGFTA